MKSITGKWQNLDGTPVAGGKLFLRLSQDSVALGTTQVSTSLISFTLDSTGSIPAGSQIWANDELQPQQTTYSMSVVAAGGGLVWGAESIYINGSSPININSFAPTTQNVMLGSPVLQNPTTPQSVTGQSLTLTPSAPLIVQGTASFGGVASFLAGTQGASFKQQTFTVSGTFTIPAGTVSVKVTVLGGGSAGGGTSGTNAASGGGAGGCAIKWLTSLTPGGTLAVTIGTGGAGVSNNTGGSGTNSTVASGTQSISTITGGGATPGGSANAGGGGEGGTASGGDFNFTGNSGFPPITNFGGVGGGSVFGGGAPFAGGTAGNAATAFGAGGSGCGNGGGTQTGGSGAAGVVIFEWIG